MRIRFTTMVCRYDVYRLPGPTHTPIINWFDKAGPWKSMWFLGMLRQHTLTLIIKDANCSLSLCSKVNNNHLLCYLSARGSSLVPPPNSTREQYIQLGNLHPRCALAPFTNRRIHNRHALPLCWGISYLKRQWIGGEYARWVPDISPGRGYKYVQYSSSISNFF